MEFEYGDFKFTVHKPSVDNALYIVVSGSHAYGWESQDSDLDIRRIYTPSIDRVLSFLNKESTHQSMEETPAGIIDITNYPIQQIMNLLAKGNGNALDNLFQAGSDTCLQYRPVICKELQDIVTEYMHNGFLGHCLGYDSSLIKDLSNATRMIKYGFHKLALCRYKILKEGLILAKHREVVYNIKKQEEYLPTKHCKDILADYLDGRKYKFDINGVYDELADLRQRLICTMAKVKMYEGTGSLAQTLDNWLIDYYLG